jgi:hypothetical protein
MALQVDFNDRYQAAASSIGQQGTDVPGAKLW